MSRAFYLVSFVVIGALLAACGSDSNGPAAGFECLGQPLPTTAPALVNVSGMVTADVLSPKPVPHAFVYGFRTGDPTPLAGDTTDTPGRYSLAISTGGIPVNGYLAISDSGHHIDTYAYPAVPLAADVTENVLMVSSSEFSFLATAAGINPVAGDGFIGVVVRNCQGTPLAGATVTSVPAGTVRYNAGGAPSSSATSTGSDGIAYIANVAAGNVTVKATASGHTLRQHVVNARGDAITVTEIQP
ncbi:MAG TPA: carboxypeptidase-like regulatory domain-containing protein [Gemmatimonadales bacterium]|jgi:hypothetical protein